jgi:hypothetical protein
MENPAHLPKYLFDKAVEMGIHTITLHFSGGNDEGYLDVHFSGDFDSDKGNPYDNGFSTLIEDWAWDSYSYSGGGDGSDYGDDIEYNLITKKVYVSDWHMVRQDSLTQEDDMTVDDSVTDEEEKA